MPAARRTSARIPRPQTPGASNPSKEDDDVNRVQRLALVALGAAALAVAGLVHKRPDAADDRPTTLPPDREPGEWRHHLKQGGGDA